MLLGSAIAWGAHADELPLRMIDVQQLQDTAAEAESQVRRVSESFFAPIIVDSPSAARLAGDQRQQGPPVVDLAPRPVDAAEHDDQDPAAWSRPPKEAAIGLPVIEPAGRPGLQLQPNVALNYDPPSPEPGAPRRRQMFLARDRRPDTDGPDPETDLPEGALEQASEPLGSSSPPYRAAGNRQPAADSSSPSGQLPSPEAAAGSLGQRIWQEGDGRSSEDAFLRRLRQQAGLGDEAFELEVLGEPPAGARQAGPAPAANAADWLRDGGPRPARRAAARFASLSRRGLQRLLATRQRLDSGLGLLLVPHAPLVLDTTQPLQQLRFRGDFGFGIDFPDRSEYFWASPVRGPGYRGAIDYREFAFMFEIGGDSLSVQTEFPLRGFSPEFDSGHGSAGDIRITQKLRLVDGDDIQVSQMLRVHTPSGNVGIGGGTGHASMEPGVLGRYRWSDWTYLHAELKYWLPMGGTPPFAGDVLTYGFGISSVWYESLTAAVIPTLELSSINFLTGQKTGPAGPLPVSRDNTAALHPGVRFAWDPGGDSGPIELAVSSGFAISRDRHYDSLLRLELRLLR